ncbi:MAG: hypothetical protein ACERJ2_00220 [Filomicrobium sp.]
MLGYLVLIALQIIAAWFGKGHVTGYIPNQGAIIDAAVEAAVIAVIVWVVGLVGSFVLKDVRTPGSSTLVTALIGALIGAAIVFSLPQLGYSLPNGIKAAFIPVAGAILGYLLRR